MTSAKCPHCPSLCAQCADRPEREAAEWERWAKQPQHVRQPESYDGGILISARTLDELERVGIEPHGGLVPA